MKKVLAFAIGTGLATVAMPSFAVEQHLDYMGVYVAATYTKPSNNALSIGDIQTHVPAPFLHPYSRSLFLSPDFNWDYSLGLSYHFANTCTRFYAEYDAYGAHDHRNADDVAITGSVLLGLDNTISATVLQHSNEWRFGFKRHIPWGSCFSTELRAFLEYDKVSQDVHSWTYDIGGRTFYQEFNSNFRGWGPGVGLQFRGVPFAQSCHLGLFASFATTLFYAKNLYNITMNLDALVPDNRIFYWNPENSRSLTGKVDIHVGLDYLRVYRVNGCPVNAGLTLGLRYMNIINAFKDGNTAAQYLLLNPIQPVGTFANFPAFGVPSDWGRVGPYLQFNLGGGNA